MNEKIESRKGSFRFGTICCRYEIWKEKENIYLKGEEIDGEELILEEVIVFSEEDSVFAEGLYSLLLKTRSYPRMMYELAEEILP